MQELNRYVNQFVEDMQSMYLRQFSENKMVNVSELNSDNITLVEQKLSKLLGLERELFPPAEIISNEQAGKIVKNTVFLLKAYNIVPDFPVNLPDIVMYRLILDFWDTEIKLIGKEHHIDLCHYEPENCPYGEYCSICRDLQDR